MKVSYSTRDMCIFLPTNENKKQRKKRKEKEEKNKHKYIQLYVHYHIVWLDGVFDMRRRARVAIVSMLRAENMMNHCRNYT